jgi:hypothetical protein
LLASGWNRKEPQQARVCRSDNQISTPIQSPGSDLVWAIAQRDQLRAQLEAAEREIAQLKRLIGGIYTYANDRSQDAELLHAGEGLNEAVCTALRVTINDVTISEIVAILEELQFPIKHHQNPLGSVYTAVTRLLSEAEAVAGEPRDGKKTYRWVRAKTRVVSSPDFLSQVVQQARDKKRRSG